MILQEFAWDAGFGENKFYCKVSEKNDGIRKTETYKKLTFPSYDLLLPNDKAIIDQSLYKRIGVNLDKLIVKYNNQIYAGG